MVGYFILKLREVFKKAKPPSQNFNQVLFLKEEKKDTFSTVLLCKNW